MIIIVYGRPAPQGSKAFKGMLKGKTGRLIANLQEQSKYVKPWRQDVVAAAREAMQGFTMFDGPLRLKMVFTMAKPAGAPKRRRTWPQSRPDISKLCRSTEDALVTAGAIRDDSRIVEYTRLAKVFPGEDQDALTSPGVLIEIHPLLELAQESQQRHLEVA